MTEAERLRRMTWTVLTREALEAGVPLGVVKRAKTRAELSTAILHRRAVERAAAPDPARR